MTQKIQRPRFKAFDSSTGEVFEDHGRWAVAYEPGWQLIRASCSFIDEKQCRISIAKLERYLLHSRTGDRSTRLFRVSNLMNALPIGQPTAAGLLRVELAEAQLIVEYRTAVKYKLQQAGLPVEWDWNFSRERLAYYHQFPTEWNQLLKINKRLQTERGARKAKKVALRFYLELIRKERGAEE